MKNAKTILLIAAAAAFVFGAGAMFAALNWNGVAP